MIQIEPYTNVLRKGVFDYFTERCFSELGKRLGSKLMQYAINYANDSGYKAIILDSMSQYKEALKLYEHFGFKFCGSYNNNMYAGGRTYGSESVGVFSHSCG